MATITYTLRILGRLPDSIPLERLGGYIRDFADLLGSENHPRFDKIKKASIGIVAKIPPDRKAHTYARLRAARSNPDSRAGRALQRIEVSLGLDHTKGAMILDADGNELFKLTVIQPANDDGPVIRQADTVDGMVTGLIGSDETMNLHLRDDHNRDINVIVRDEDLAMSILKHFRRGTIRVLVDGPWERTSEGWIPKASKCVVRSFELLEPSSIRETLDHMASVPGNGWDGIDDPVAAWKELRGIH